jgi:hypothetical protein
VGEEALPEAAVAVTPLLRGVWCALVSAANLPSASVGLCFRSPRAEGGAGSHLRSPRLGIGKTHLATALGA